MIRRGRVWLKWLIHVQHMCVRSAISGFRGLMTLKSVVPLLCVTSWVVAFASESEPASVSTTELLEAGQASTAAVADEHKACAGEILAIEGGAVRLVSADGTSRISVVGSDIHLPLCILKAERPKRRFLVALPSHEGEWWLKTRYVVESTLEPAVRDECQKPIAFRLPDSGNIGGTRGSGADPCE